MKTRYVKSPAVKQLAHEKGRRVAPSFLLALDAFIQKKIEEAARAHNGGKITLDAEVAGFVGVKP